MLSVTDLELVVAARTLVHPTTFQVRPGDRVGLVGRNGAGKTTLARALAGEALPASGRVVAAGSVAYLPQDPRTGDLEVTARDRVLSARGLDALHRELQELAGKMGSVDDAARDQVMRRYSSVEERFESLGGWSAGSEAASIISSLGLAERVLDQPLRTLSGGQRRRVELARVLFSGAGTLLLDEPTNHLDADSILWLRSFLRSYEGGFVVISHDPGLLEATVNRVFYLDASRAVIDIYNLPWRAYLEQRVTDDRRRQRERDHATRRIDVMRTQADKMRAKATKARAAHQLDRRAAALEASISEERHEERVARLRFPDPAPSGRVPLQASGLTKTFGSLEVFADVDLSIDRGSRVVVLGLNGAGKTTLLRLLAGVDEPDAGQVDAGHGLRLGYYAQEHETLDPDASVFANVRRQAPAAVTDVELRRVLGAFLFGGDRVDQLAGTVSGGEKTRLALATLVVSQANVLLLDEPTNNLDPASREEVLGALVRYAGAIVLVTHDPGAVEALSPERVLLMPDGVEDLWSDEFADLVALGIGLEAKLRRDHLQRHPRQRLARPGDRLRPLLRRPRLPRRDPQGRGDRPRRRRRPRLGRCPPAQGRRRGGRSRSRRDRLPHRVGTREGERVRQRCVETAETKNSTADSVGIALTVTGKGYLILTSKGAIDPYDDAIVAGRPSSKVRPFTAIALVT